MYECSKINATEVRPVRYGSPSWPFILLGLILIGPAAGCGPGRTPYPESLMSERPAERAAAVKHAAEIEDHSVIHILVDRLEDEDEAVRFFAIIALEKLTGERRGYAYHDSPAERARAVQRWRRYLAETDNNSRDLSGGSDL